MLDILIENVILLNKPLNNFKLEDAARRLMIPSFRRVFLLDTLPRKLNKKECGIVNLDKSGGPGTHWVAWYINGKTKIYIDSYGIQSPIELSEYERNKYFAVICVCMFSKNSVQVMNSKAF